MTEARVVIVGGGFAGVVVAIHLLESTRKRLKLTIVEPREQTGRGIAYSTTLNDHLVNGPAKAFGVHPDTPEHLAHWLRDFAGARGWAPPAGVGWQDAFPPRWLYGDYIRAAFDAALRRARHRVDYLHVHDRAVELVHEKGRQWIRTAAGESIAADKIILATGLFESPPTARPEISGALAASPAYIASPYADNAARDIGEARSILVIGSSLSAVDAVLGAEANGFSGRFTLLSRHGLLAQTRRDVLPWPGLFAAGLPTTVRGLLAAVQPVRRLLRDSGGDWQQISAAVREQIVPLWSGASQRERQRFVRHLRRFWEISLHRLAPESGRRLDAIVASGRLDQRIGHIRSLDLDAGGRAVLRWTPRGQGEPLDAGFDRVIDARGYEFDWNRVADPLVASLVAQGRVRPHALGFGIEADPSTGAVGTSGGGFSQSLFAVGHPMRGVTWESNSIGEQVAGAVRTARAVATALEVRTAGAPEAQAELQGG